MKNVLLIILALLLASCESLTTELPIVEEEIISANDSLINNN